jgi:CRP-like cAMP-binding protein
MHPDDAAPPLDRIPLFRGLGAHALAEIAAAARSRHAAAGEVIFQEGDSAGSFFTLRSGSVKLTQLSAEGHVVVMRLVGPGDAFGGVAAFGTGPYPVTATAVTDTTALEWPGPVMTGLMERHTRLALNAVRFVAARLHELQEQYRQLATERVERRIARALLRLVRQSGRRTDEGVLIDLPLSREDLAQMTGTTLYTVSRVLTRWETDGIVESGRQRVTVRTPHTLVMIADDIA